MRNSPAICLRVCALTRDNKSTRLARQQLGFLRSYSDPGVADLHNATGFLGLKREYDHMNAGRNFIDIWKKLLNIKEKPNGQPRILE